MRRHHVQVACPPGGEATARRFYADGLGLVEVDKPQPLRARGGVWFRGYDGHGGTTVEIHVGAEEPFVPARKAHPGILLDDERTLEEIAARLERLGFPVDRTERHTFPGYVRVHTSDGHGNRVELLGLGEGDRSVHFLHGGATTPSPAQPPLHPDRQS